MIDRGMNRLSRLTESAILAGLGIIGCIVCVAAGGSDTPPLVASNSPAGGNLNVRLEYREVPFSIMRVGLATTTQPGAFKKEPQFASTTVRRARLNLPGSKDKPMPFLWDPQKGKLYLDLNRNEDLTDEPAGAFSSAINSSSGSDFRQGTFTNVQLTVQTDAGPCPWLVDLNISEYRNQLSVYAEVRSFWAARAMLARREWQVGWISGWERRLGVAKDDYLLLRPWEERDSRFNVQDGSLEAFSFPKKIFIQSLAYELECASVRDGEKPGRLLKLTPSAAELGELSVSGKFIERVLLTDGPCVAVLDAPQGALHVPAGAYRTHLVQLGNGDARAHLQQASRRELVITKDKPATLAVGGPLTNSVTFSRRGNYLALNYQLLGVGGVAYATPTRDYQHPPQFAVFQGGKKIGSGKFEFG